MALEDMGMEEMGSSPEAAAPLDDFAAAVQDAFPAEDWTPERTMALKDAIRICLEDDRAGEYNEKPSGGPDLALVLGPPPKKRKS